MSGTMNGLGARCVLVLGACAGGASAQSVLYSVSGQLDEAIGSTVKSVGDIDGDGSVELAVMTAKHPAGTVYLYSGRTGTLLHEFVQAPSAIGFGNAIAGNGDVNGDGVNDIIIGAPGGAPGFVDGQRGSAFIYSGIHTGDPLTDYPLIRQHIGEPYANLGWSVAILGDLNGDGKAEYAIGAPNAGFLGSNICEVTVFSGADGSVLHTYTAQTAGSNFGQSIVRLDDATGDGVADFAIGELGASSGGFVANGAARIYSGATLLPYTAVVGDSYFARVGMSVASLGDVNGDGMGDLVATIFDKSAFLNGAVVGSGADGMILTRCYGDIQVSSPSATGAASIMDADGDGLKDFMFIDTNRINGQVMIASSATGQRLYVAKPVSPSHLFPASIDGLDDVNEDGFPEFVVGDQGSSPPGVNNTGTAWVFTTRPLQATPPVLSAAAPQAIQFGLNPGIAHAGSAYIVLASVTSQRGGCSGFSVGPQHVHVPFCVDLLTRMSLSLINTPIFQTTAGTLDPYTGSGSATFDVSGIVLPPDSIGTQLNFFLLTKAPNGGAWDKCWESVMVEIVP